MTDQSAMEAPVLPDALDISHYDGVTRDRRWELSSASILASVVDYERNLPTAGIFKSDSFHYLDMCLSGRSVGSRACFPDMFVDRLRLGRVFLVPASFRLEAEGGRGRQKILRLLIPANPLFDDENLLGAGLENSLRHCLHIENANLSRMLKSVSQEVCAPDSASSIVVEGMALSAIGYLLRLLGHSASFDTAKGGLPQWRIKRIRERVNEGSLPSIMELANLCGISRRQLMRAFREETGSTIGDYVQSVAIDRAKLNLRSSDLPISLIAAKSGFKNASAFSAAFRRVTGQTPRSFRANS